MQVSTLQIPDGPKLRVYLIDPDEFDQNVEARRKALSDASNNLTAGALTPHN